MVSGPPILIQSGFRNSFFSMGYCFIHPHDNQRVSVVFKTSSNVIPSCITYNEKGGEVPMKQGKTRMSSTFKMKLVRFFKKLESSTKHKARDEAQAEERGEKRDP